MRKDEALFQPTADGLTFRGLRVERRRVRLNGRTFELAALEDASALLDLPDYADRFVRHDSAPYGLELWPAATMLCQHVVASDAPNGRVLEIGAGIGLVSIVAASCGWSVVASDREEEALRFTAHNARINGVRLAGYRLLDWNHPPQGESYNRILAADVLYQVIDHKPLLHCIDRLLAADGLAIVADPNRGVADRFEWEARDAGFAATSQAARSENHRGDEVAGRLFFLRRQ